MYKVLIINLCIVLAACSTSKEKIFKGDMPTMKEIYVEKFHQLGVGEKPIIDRGLVSTNKLEQTMPNVPIASSYAELQQQFPKAPNPMMLMFIFPHLTHSGTPVPEYNTYFNLYEVDHFTVYSDKE